MCHLLLAVLFDTFQKFTQHFEIDVDFCIGDSRLCYGTKMSPCFPHSTCKLLRANGITVFRALASASKLSLAYLCPWLVQSHLATGLYVTGVPIPRNYCPSRFSHTTKP